jgi:copper(I)-binding protein
MKIRREILTSVPGIVFFSVLLTGCGSGDTQDLEVVDAWARPMVVQETPGAAGAGGNSAVYLTLANRGRVADTLLGGASPVASRVEIHESFLDGDIMRMREVGPMEIGAGETLTLQPGGLHIMLVGLRGSLVAGDTIPLTLRFRRAGARELRVPVRAMSPGGM